MFSTKKTRRLVYAALIVIVTYMTTGYVDLTIFNQVDANVPIDRGHQNIMIA